MNKEERRHWHACVFSADMTPGERLVLLALETFTDYPDGTNAWPGEEKLAEMCRCSTRTVERALHQGAELKLIEQTAPAIPKAGRAAVYRLLPQPVSTRQPCQVETSVGDDFNLTAVTVQPDNRAVLPDSGDRSTRQQCQPTSPLPVPEHQSLDHQEKPDSLHSSGKEIARSQAISRPIDFAALHRQAQRIVTRYVGWQHKDRKNRHDLDSAVKGALEHGLDENTIIEIIGEWQKVPRPHTDDLRRTLTKACDEIRAEKVAQRLSERQQR
jgi:hypothetical protein